MIPTGRDGEEMDNVAVTSHYASYPEAAFTRCPTQPGEDGVRTAMGHWPMSLINPELRTRLPARESARAWGTF